MPDNSHRSHAPLLGGLADAEITEHERVRALHRAAVEHRDSLLRRRSETAALDLKAAAVAFAEGKPSGGTPHADALAAEIAAAERQVTVGAAAVRSAYAPLRDRLAATEDEWLALLDQEAAEASEDLDALLDAVPALLDRLDGIEATRRFLLRPERPAQAARDTVALGRDTVNADRLLGALRTYRRRAAESESVGITSADLGSLAD